MGHIQEELNRLEEKIKELNHSDIECKALYAARQALLWVVEPDCYATPADTIKADYDGRPNLRVYEVSQDLVLAGNPIDLVPCSMGKQCPDS